MQPLLELKTSTSYYKIHHRLYSNWFEFSTLEVAACMQTKLVCAITKLPNLELKRFIFFLPDPENSAKKFAEILARVEDDEVATRQC